MTKHTILFLAANPLSTDRLALDEEARAIHEELERSGHRERFELVTRWAVRPLDLLRALRKLKPTVVHFSGHGGRGALRPGSAPSRDVVSELGGDDRADDSDQQHGLFFQGPDGRPQLVSTSALQETFGAAGSSVKLVVLGACYSDAQADVLLAHVAGVVGMGGSIRDDAGRSFAIGFYGGLGEGQSVAAACRQGCAAISLTGLPDGERPQLRVRDGMDAERFVLAPATRLDRSRGSRALWAGVGVAVTIAICAPSAWLIFVSRLDPPPVSPGPAPGKSITQVPPPRSPESPPAGPMVQPRAPTPVEPTLTPPPMPRDCKRTDVTSPMCSYRGTLRKMNGTPMSNIKVELMGTDCTTMTTELGAFDFKACDPNQTRRLKHPSIFLHLQDDKVCEKIPLQDPPLVTEIHIDLQTCHRRWFAAHPREPLDLSCKHLQASICQRLHACYSTSELAGDFALETYCRSWSREFCERSESSKNEANNYIPTIMRLGCTEIRRIFHLVSKTPKTPPMHIQLGLPIPDSLP